MRLDRAPAGTNRKKGKKQNLRHLRFCVLLICWKCHLNWKFSILNMPVREHIFYSIQSSSGMKSSCSICLQSVILYIRSFIYIAKNSIKSVINSNFYEKKKLRRKNSHYFHKRLVVSPFNITFWRIFVYYRINGFFRSVTVQRSDVWWRKGLYPTCADFKLEIPSSKCFFIILGGRLSVWIMKNCTSREHSKLICFCVCFFVCARLVPFSVGWDITLCTNSDRDTKRTKQTKTHTSD